MSRFVDKTATDEIILKNGDRVQVRRGLTAAELGALYEAAAQMEYDTVTQQAKMTGVRWGSGRSRTLKAYIVDWNFQDDDGKPVPYKPELVDELDEATVDELNEALGKLMEARDAERTKKAG